MTPLLRFDPTPSGQDVVPHDAVWPRPAATAGQTKADLLAWVAGMGLTQEQAAALLAVRWVVLNVFVKPCETGSAGPDRCPEC